MPKFDPLTLHVANVEESWTAELRPPNHPGTVITLHLRSLSMQQIAAAESYATELMQRYVLGSGIDKATPLPAVDGHPVIVSRDAALAAAIIDKAQMPGDEHYTARDLLMLMVDNDLSKQLRQVFVEVLEQSGKSSPAQVDADPLA